MIDVDLEVNFKNWLIKQGLSEITKSGKPSTVYDYFAAINTICKKEGYTWENLAINLFFIISYYHGKYKTALYKYNEYLFTADLSYNVRQARNKNILYALSLDENKRITFNGDQLLYTPEETATILRVSVRTLARWRQHNIGPEYRKDNRTGKITYPKSCIERYLNESLIRF